MLKFLFIKIACPCLSLAKEVLENFVMSFFFNMIFVVFISC